LRRDELIGADGFADEARGDYASGVGVVLQSSDGRIVMIEQYRHATKQFC